MQLYHTPPSLNSPQEGVGYQSSTIIWLFDHLFSLKNVILGMPPQTESICLEWKSLHSVFVFKTLNTLCAVLFSVMINLCWLQSQHRCDVPVCSFSMSPVRFSSFHWFIWFNLSDFGQQNNRFLLLSWQSSLLGSNFGGLIVNYQNNFWCVKTMNGSLASTQSFLPKNPVKRFNSCLTGMLCSLLASRM